MFNNNHQFRIADKNFIDDVLSLLHGRAVIVNADVVCGCNQRPEFPNDSGGSRSVRPRVKGIIAGDYLFGDAT